MIPILLPSTTNLYNFGTTLITFSSPPPPALTWIDRVDALSPSNHYRLDEEPRTTMADRIGNVDGAFQNLDDLTFEVDPLVLNSDGGKSIGFGRGSSPGHATIFAPLQSASFSIVVACQLSTHRDKHLVLTTGQAGNVPGMFSVEFIDDGSGGMKPRVFSIDDNGDFVIYVGTQSSTVPIGEAFILSYVRNSSNGTQRIFVNDSEIPLTLTDGTQPASWSAVPEVTWFFGIWSTLVAPFHGLLAELVLFDRALAPNEITSLAVPQSVVWLSDFDAGTVQTGESKTIELLSHAFPEIGLSASITEQGDFGTASVDGDSINYEADAELEGVNFDSFKATITKGTITSREATINIEITEEPGEPTVGENVLDFLVGSCLEQGGAVGNTRQRYGPNVDHAFQYYFVGPRSGLVTRFGINRRIDVANTTVQHRSNVPGKDGTTFSGNFDISQHSQSYSNGNAGTYDLLIYPANPATKRRVPGSSPLGGLFGWEPGSIVRRTGSNNDDNWGFPVFNNPILDLTQPVEIVFNQPYVLVINNIGSNPSSNYFSVNFIPDIISGLNGAPNNPEPPPFINPPAGYPSAGWTPAIINGVDHHPWPAATFGSGASVSSRQGPLLWAMFYEDGGVGHYGTGGGGWRNTSFPNWQAFSSSAHVRERFMPFFNITIDGIWFRCGRKGSQSGNIVWRLEQGPSSDTSGNGTVLREVSMSINSLTNVTANAIHRNEGRYLSWAFLPFDPITLQEDTIYNIRGLVSGAGEFWTGGNPNIEGPQHKWSPIASSWAEHKTKTPSRPIDRWMFSRGLMTSSNSGSSWSYWHALHRRTGAIAFRRVI